MKTVAVSGGFDPIHIGHVRHIKEAKKLGDKLMVILTRDDQLIKKKGYVFMVYDERKEILENIIGVDEVVENVDKDITSNESLEFYKPDIFAKGGDRTPESMPEEEILVCERIKCKIAYDIGGEKIESSSALVEKIRAGNNLD
jgi:cytidyltransferase-like protein